MKSPPICFLVVFFLLVSVVSVELDEEASHHRRFNQFKRRFNKNYVSDEEEAVRFIHFKNSLKRIEERNRKWKGKGATYSINKFSDLSVEEFKDKYLTAKVPINQRVEGVEVMKPTIDFDKLPSTFDWRKKGVVTPVKDQQQCGSCWAFSVTENIESKWLMAGKANASSLRLAPQQLVDCSELNQGCNGGITGLAFEYVLMNGGLESEADYPYEAVDQACAFDKSKVVASISNWKYATWDWNENEVKSNLVSWGPLSICVDAANWQDYSGGVMTWEECAYINILDHCVQLVGYAVDKDAGKYWIVRNSWNTDWGINGYIHLQMGHDTCGMAHQAASAFV